VEGACRVNARVPTCECQSEQRRSGQAADDGGRRNVEWAADQKRYCQFASWTPINRVVCRSPDNQTSDVSVRQECFGNARLAGIGLNERRRFSSSSMTEIQTRGLAFIEFDEKHTHGVPGELLPFGQVGQ